MVEGEDDVLAFRSWLGKLNVNWENRWVVAPAGKKLNVLALLEKGGLGRCSRP